MKKMIVAGALIVACAVSPWACQGATPSAWFAYNFKNGRCDRAPVAGLPWTASPASISAWFKGLGMTPKVVSHSTPGGGVYFVEVTMPWAPGTATLDMFPDVRFCQAFAALTSGAATPTIPAAP